MRDDIQSADIDRILVKYHAQALNFEPDETAVIVDRGTIDRLLGWIHRIPAQGDDRWDPPFEAEYPGNPGPECPRSDRSGPAGAALRVAESLVRRYGTSLDGHRCRPLFCGLQRNTAARLRIGSRLWSQR